MKILLTGATGYIGRRLKERLLGDEDLRLRIFVRNRNKIREKYRDSLEIFEGSTFDTDALRKALEGIDVAYYLIHSMGAKGDFEELDRLSAKNFLDACIGAKVKKIIYLGGLGDEETASRHLLSRIETGKILSSCPDLIQTVWFRAGIIIGSGSASFEIIRHLVQKLPVMITPRWVSTKTQPICASDVFEYLYRAKDLETEESLVVDIGSEKMSFKEMMTGASRVMGLKRRLIPVPVLSPKLSSYWLVLMTPIPFGIAGALIEGLKSETIMKNDNAKRFFPEIRPLSYEDSIAMALADIENNQVISRWCDSGAKQECDIKGQDRIAGAVLTHKITRDLGNIPTEKAFHAIQSLGGDNGWFRYEWLWKIRGLVDKLLGGPGFNRGRRDPVELRIGDSLDFWKVIDIQEGKRLLLLAQMRLPGKAWLDFSIEKGHLIQTSYFLPKGLWGRVYWFLINPFHGLVFKDIARGVVQRAGDLA